MKNIDCSKCENRGRIDGLSQETFCDGCINYGNQYKKDHFKPKGEIMKNIKYLVINDCESYGGGYKSAIEFETKEEMLDGIQHCDISKIRVYKVAQRVPIKEQRRIVEAENPHIKPEDLC